jgi:hypothetical protein
MKDKKGSYSIMHDPNFADDMLKILHGPDAEEIFINLRDGDGKLHKENVEAMKAAIDKFYENKDKHE